MIIYAGELQMRVDASRVTATLDGAIDAAEALGGYFAARNDASVQLRIPSARFRESLARLESLGAVTHRAIRASDVSEEHHDFEVRLANLRATRARMQELLSRAASMSDTLTVERELERVAQEIDGIEGKLAFLESHAAFSQIDLAVEAKPLPAVAQAADPPPPRLVDLPIPWLGALGVGRLLTLR
jgi:hypothetical protein